MQDGDSEVGDHYSSSEGEAGNSPARGSNGVLTLEEQSLRALVGFLLSPCLVYCPPASAPSRLNGGAHIQSWSFSLSYYPLIISLWKCPCRQTQEYGTTPFCTPQPNQVDQG